MKTVMVLRPNKNNFCEKNNFGIQKGKGKLDIERQVFILFNSFNSKFQKLKPLFSLFSYSAQTNLTSVEKYDFRWTEETKILDIKRHFLFFLLQFLPKYSVNKTLHIFIALRKHIIYGGKKYFFMGERFFKIKELSVSHKSQIF